MIAPPKYPPVIRGSHSHGVLRVLACLLLVGVVLLGAAVAGVASYFRLSSDTAALRDAVRSSATSQWRTVINCNLGSLTFLLARMGLSCVSLPPEARAGLASVRACEVGVYECAELSPAGRPALLARADQAMTRRGWERMVGVLDRGELVAVYLPRDVSSPRNFKVCILVVAEHQVVVASARANLEPLISHLLERSDIAQQLPLPPLALR